MKSSRTKLRLVLVVVAVVAAGILGLALLPRLLPASALVGEWVHRDGNQTSEIDLLADGRFTLTHIPRSVMDRQYPLGDEGLWGATVDVTGSWSRYSQEQITLITASGDMPSVGQIASIGGWPWALEIWIAYGDPEVGRTFHFTKQ